MLGQFITLEGSEGAGKSTLLRYLQQYLLQHSLSTIATREPGGTPLAEAIRELLLQPRQETVYPVTELLLMFAGRAQHYQEVILPALKSGHWVLCDRFVDASYAYQVTARGISKQAVDALHTMVCGDHLPNLTLLLDLDVQLGFARTHKRTAGKDRIEQEDLSFFQAVREGYLQRAAAFPERIKIIDASQPYEQVKKQAIEILQDFIERNK